MRPVSVSDGEGLVDLSAGAELALGAPLSLVSVNTCSFSVLVRAWKHHATFEVLFGITLTHLGEGWVYVTYVLLPHPPLSATNTT